MIHKYSRQKDGDVFLSPHFQVREFCCRDGSDQIVIDNRLVDVLEGLRQQFGQPVIINSAYRSADHNKAVGGAPKSQHLLGTAADIVVADVDPLQVCRATEEILAKMGVPGGIGHYVGRFTHVDVRGWRSRWRQAGPGTAIIALRKEGHQ